MPHREFINECQSRLTARPPWRELREEDEGEQHRAEGEQRPDGERDEARRRRREQQLLQARPHGCAGGSATITQYPTVFRRDRYSLRINAEK